MPRPSSPPPARQLTDVSADASQIRAKYLRPADGRTERPLRDPSARHSPYFGGDIMNRAMNLWTRDHGGNNCVLARWLGVDESVVRALRLGEKVMTLARLSQCPPELQELVLRLYREEVLHAH